MKCMDVFVYIIMFVILSIQIPLNYFYIVLCYTDTLFIIRFYHVTIIWILTVYVASQL